MGFGPYGDRVARTYDDSRFGTTRGRVLDILEARMLQKGVRVLERSYGRSAESVADVPAGTGRMLRRLPQACRVIAIDASSDMLDLAKAKVNGDRFEFRLGRVEELPLEDRSVDIVVSVRLFGHLSSPEMAQSLSEFARVARMGAVVFFAGDSKWLRWRKRRRRQRDGAAWHPMTDVAARELADTAGFRTLAVARLLGFYSETRCLVLSARDVRGGAR